MLAERYFVEMKNVLEAIEQTQKEPIRAAAEAIVESVVNGGVWHLFDTGHILMFEAVGRAGGLMMVTPIHSEIRVAHPVRPRPLPPNPEPFFMDQIADLPRYILGQAKVQAGDVILIGSVSGINVMSVEMACLARERGIKTIALTSVGASKRFQSKHPSGKRLFEMADLVIDNCVPYGDALVEVEELGGQKICPASGIAASYINWALQAEVVEQLVARGLKPSAYVSNHLPDAGKLNAAARARYEEQGY
jgi:uncharacterized phosphosugar-binding protein